MLMRVMHKRLFINRVASLTAVIALGTHSYMEDNEIDRWFGVAGQGQPASLEDAYPGMKVVNHEWADPQMLVNVGTISGERIGELSEGRLEQGGTILINRHVVEADISIVVGPVFPHEVVGISGGNKYFIPGVASQQFIDMTHWVGALITSTEIIGTTGVTPVRAMINEGCALIPTERLALCCVVGESGSGELEAAAFGTATRTLGRRPPRLPPRPTSPTSTSLSRGCWPVDARPATKTSGRQPKASTRPNLRWLTEARW